MKVFIDEVRDYDFDKIYRFLKKATEESGLWQKLEDKKNILIKPNLLGAYHPDKAVTVHPVVLDALITLLKEHDKVVRMGDSPGGAVSLTKVWQETGARELCEKHNIELVNFSEGGIVVKQNNDIEYTMTKYFWDADAVINVSKYKTHSLMYYTGAIKNLYGLIPGLKKSDYHRQKPTTNDFAEVISGLYGIVKEKIAFNIMDGIWGMEGEGPSAGDPRNFGVIFASESAPALDYVASGMMGFSLDQLGYIATSLVNDSIHVSDIELPSRWKSFVFKHVKIKKVSLLIKIIAYSPRFIRTLFDRLFEYYPAFNDKCKLCKICVNSCPVNAMELRKGDKHPKIDYNKCIKCMCCHELCPYHAVYIKKSFLAKLILK